MKHELHRVTLTLDIIVRADAHDAVNVAKRSVQHLDRGAGEWRSASVVPVLPGDDVDRGALPWGGPWGDTETIGSILDRMADTAKAPA